jgi:putative Holliday junction resolvase
MARTLALDIGLRRTGVAYLDDAVGVVLPLETIVHDSFDVLEEAVRNVIAERSIDRVVLGLPLLPGGGEGEQARLVRSFADRLRAGGIPCTFMDERYSTTRELVEDKDAAAACLLLEAAASQESS